LATLTKFKDPYEAARSGRSRKAAGEFISEKEHRRMTIIFEPGKTPIVTFPGAPGIEIRKAASKEVDSVKSWRNLQEV